MPELTSPSKIEAGVTATVQPIIKVENLNVVYNLGKNNEVRALTDINLEIYPQEFVIFFGPSGCGKSTLLYSVSGLETNTQGDIYIQGKNLSLFNKDEILNFHRKTIGMIFQAFYLISSLTVVRNVALPQIFMGHKKADRRKKALELLEYFGVKAQAYKMPQELSGGQQQRVAISRSLVNDPDVIMADEPVGNLDSKSAQDVMDILRDLNENQKKTIILVTHDPAWLNLAHRVVYLRDGHVVEVKVNREVKGVTIPKQELKKDISRELELLINTFSSLSPDQVGNLLVPFKAKQIVSEVLIGMTIEEVERIEKRVESMLMTGVFQDETTVQFLDEGEEKGGLGLDHRTAVKITERVKDIVQEIKILEDEDKRIKLKLSPDTGNEVMQVRHYLLAEYDVEIKSFAALEIFDQAVRDRIATIIDRETFVKRLYASIKSGGVGIGKRTAKKIGKRLELLILGKYK